MFEDKKRLYFIIAGIVALITIGVVVFVMTRPAPKAVVDNSPVTLNWWKVAEGYDETAIAEIIANFQKIPSKNR